MLEELQEQIKQLCQPVLTAQEVELIELILTRERGRTVVRFLVDQPQGINLDQCARLNRELSRILDQADLMQESYVLEVSSPGLDRPLLTTRDFQRARSKLVRFMLHTPLERQNVWLGFIDQVDDRELVLRTENGRLLRIARDNLAKARLEIKLGH